MAANGTFPPPALPVRISREGRQAICRATYQLEAIAATVRQHAIRDGATWQDLQEQWDRLRELEAGLRWMIGPR